MSDFQSLIESAVLLVPSLSACIVVFINLLKKAGAVKDGEAAKWNKVLHVVIYGVLLIWAEVQTDVSGSPIDWQGVDAVAHEIASFGPALLALVPLAIRLAGEIYEGLRGLPLVGFSHNDN